VSASDLERVAWLDAAGELREVENIHARPDEAWRVTPRDWRGIVDGAVLLIHSHPSGEEIPSFQDMRTQIAMAIPWAICPRGSDPFLLGADLGGDLLGRGYRFGVTDCWGCFRRAFFERRGIALQDFPRVFGFWRSGEPLFESNFQTAGFTKIDGSIRSALPGDGIAFKIRSEVFNHCGYYVGEGQMIHHPSGLSAYDPTRVSRRESVNRWLRLPHEVYRYAGA
jgi:proteasome lid subunit RPN8/RPN11